MGRIGPIGIWELLVILLVVLLIFGARRLPELARGIGLSVREFRNGVREVDSDVAGAASDNGSGRRSANRSERTEQQADSLANDTPATTKS